MTDFNQAQIYSNSRSLSNIIMHILKVECAYKSIIILIEIGSVTLTSNRYLLFEIKLAI